MAEDKRDELKEKASQIDIKREIYIAVAFFVKTSLIEKRPDVLREAMGCYGAKKVYKISDQEYVLIYEGRNVLEAGKAARDVLKKRLASMSVKMGYGVSEDLLEALIKAICARDGKKYAPAAERTEDDAVATEIVSHIVSLETARAKEEQKEASEAPQKEASAVDDKAADWERAGTEFLKGNGSGEQSGKPKKASFPERKKPVRQQETIYEKEEGPLYDRPYRVNPLRTKKAAAIRRIRYVVAYAVPFIVLFVFFTKVVGVKTVTVKDDSRLATEGIVQTGDRVLYLRNAYIIKGPEEGDCLLWPDGELTLAGESDEDADSSRPGRAYMVVGEKMKLL